MRRLICFAAGLYPPSWRKRYGIEFDALLEDAAPDWRGLLDILKGALVMQIRMFGITVASFAVIGALIAVIVAFRIPSKYASSAVLQVQTVESPTAIKEIFQDSFTQSALAAVIMNERLYGYQGDRDVGSINKAIHRFRQATGVHVLHTAGNSGAATIEITFADRDPVKAQRVAGELIRLIMEAGVAHHDPGVSLIYAPAPPNLPTSPWWPNRWVIVELGGAAGLLAGLVQIRLRRFFRQHQSGR